MLLCSGRWCWTLAGWCGSKKPFRTLCSASSGMYGCTVSLPAVGWMSTKEPRHSPAVLNGINVFVMLIRSTGTGGRRHRIAPCHQMRT